MTSESAGTSVEGPNIMASETNGDAESPGGDQRFARCARMQRDALVISESPRCNSLTIARGTCTRLRPISEGSFGVPGRVADVAKGNVVNLTGAIRERGT